MPIAKVGGVAIIAAKMQSGLKSTTAGLGQTRTSLAPMGAYPQTLARVHKIPTLLPTRMSPRRTWPFHASAGQVWTVSADVRLLLLRLLDSCVVWP